MDREPGWKSLTSLKVKTEFRLKKVVTNATYKRASVLRFTLDHIELVQDSLPENLARDKRFSRKSLRQSHIKTFYLHYFIKDSAALFEILSICNRPTI